MSPQPETPADELARIRSRFPEWEPDRVLEAMGHPGYGDEFAAEVLTLIETDEFGSVHFAVDVARHERWRAKLHAIEPSPFEQAVDDAIARENARYLESRRPR